MGNSVHPWPEPERVLVVCHHCHASLSVKRIRIGQVIRCKQCDHELLVNPPVEDGPTPRETSGANSAGAAVAAVATRRKIDEQIELIRSQNASLQSELEKLSVAHNLLEAEAEQLRLERTEILAETKKLTDQRNGLSQELEVARAAEARAESEKRATLDESEQHRSDFNRERAELQTEIDRLQQALALQRGQHQDDRRQTAGELDELRGAKERLQAEVDGLRLEHAEAVAQNKRLNDERDSLSVDLDAARAAQERAESEKQAAFAKAEDHRSDAARDRANLAAEVERFQQVLQSQSGQHQDELGQRIGELDQFRRAHQALEADVARLAREHEEVVARNKRLNEERDSLCRDLDLARAAHERAESEKEAFLVQAEDHRSDLARDRANLESEIERLHEALASLEQDCKSQHGRNRELDQAHARFAAEMQSKIGFEESRRLQLEEELRAVKHESATLKESLARASAVAQSQAEPRAQSRADQIDELETARAEIARLRTHVEELKRLPNDLTNVLHGIGLRVDVG
jgi:chromosome segregation ATPase